MDRTEDLLRIAEVFRSDETPAMDTFSKRELRPSQYLNLAQRVASNIESNEALVRRMDKLSARKEFSNDPTVEMAEISDLFHMKVAVIQREFEALKGMTEDRLQQISGGQQQILHYKLLMQVLNKRHLNHIESFKKALKVHSEHVLQRQKRVVKYGQGLEQIRAGAGKGGIDMSSNSYAMFSSSMQGNQSMSEIQKSQELRRRPGTGTEDSSFINQNINQNPNQNPNSRAPIKAGDLYRVYSGGSSNGYNDNSGHAQGGSSQYMQMQLQQQQRPDRDYVSRVKGAEKVEKAISQVHVQSGPPYTRQLTDSATNSTMGRLFSQMATLVLEQSETLSRIEDDVEIGLSDTKEAHVSMTNLYDITKGNRGMIIKIFLLLIFFIFLFLVWT